jgi:hypothetical protein
LGGERFFGERFSLGDFPWEHQPDEVACNLALGDLINNLPRRLTVNGRIHAETFITASGAIAGFAAQQALFFHLTEAKDNSTLDQIKVVTTKTGGKYYFGEPLNRTLFPQSNAEGPLKLWSLAAGAAVANGLHQSDLPDPAAMFAHVSQALGGELEGLPSIPKQNHPQLPAKELLKLVWPLAMMCFSGELSGVVAKSGAVTQRWRPVISARAAHTFMRQVKDVLDPNKAVILVMEGAIYASKLNRTDVETSSN